MKRRVFASLAVLLGTAFLIAGTIDRPESAVAETPVTVAATGDLGGSVSEISPVANLMKSWGLDRFLLLGDICYPDGTVSCYTNVIKPVYGPIQAQTIAAPGNHDAHTTDIAGFYSFYPDPLPKLWDIGNGWVVITVNTEVAHDAGSAQELAVKTLTQQAKADGKHIIAITHHPRYTGGSSHSDDTALAAIWADLDAAGADLFLAGHQHIYERYQPADSAGHFGSGIRSFVVGTGGNGLYSCTSHTGREVCLDQYHGALKLALYSDRYEWQFVDTSGAVRDSGSSPTRSAGNPTTTTTQPTTTTTAPPTSTSTTNPPTTTTTTPQTGCVDQGAVYGPATWFHVVYDQCIVGGVVWASNPWTDSWLTFHSTGGWVVRGNALISGTTAVNVGDSYHFEAGSLALFNVRGLYGHDDCVENDRHLSGYVVASTCVSYVSYSDSGEFTNDGSGNRVSLAFNRLELLPIPSPYKGPSPGSGPWFKTDANSATVNLAYNTLIAHQLPNHGTLGPPAHVGECYGNVIFWTGTGPFPAADAWLAACPDTQIITNP